MGWNPTSGTVLRRSVGSRRVRPRVEAVRLSTGYERAEDALPVELVRTTDATNPSWTFGGPAPDTGFLGVGIISPIPTSPGPFARRRRHPNAAPALELGPRVRRMRCRKQAERNVASEHTRRISDEATRTVSGHKKSL